MSMFKAIIHRSAVSRFSTRILKVAPPVTGRSLSTTPFPFQFGPGKKEDGFTQTVMLDVCIVPLGVGLSVSKEVAAVEKVLLVNWHINTILLTINLIIYRNLQE